MFSNIDGDLNDDGLYDVHDIDTLAAAIRAGINDARFDLNGDDLVSLADRDAWLAEAGRVNLGPRRAYLLGDANLDGLVDSRELLHLEQAQIFR